MKFFKRIIPVFVLLVLVSGSVSAQDIFEVEKGLYSTRELEMRYELGPQKQLLIKSAVNLSGILTIKTAEQKEIYIIYTKQSRTDSWSKAMDYIDLISVSLNMKTDKVRLELRAPNPAPWQVDIESGVVEAELVIPYGFEVVIEATYFDVFANGPFKEVIINSSLGRHDISAVTDLLKINTANRRVNISDIAGDIAVTTSNAPLVVSDVKNVKGQAVFRNDGGDIKIDGFIGGINVKNSFGQIKIERFQPQGQSNYIRGFSGPVILEIDKMNEGQLVVTNRYEDIDLTVPNELSAFYSMVVDDEGEIEVVNVPFTVDLVRRNRLNLTTGEGEVEISGTVRGKGNIFIRGMEGE